MSETATKASSASRGKRDKVRLDAPRRHKKSGFRRTPARNVRRKLGRGDWLVQQVKSDIGISPKRHETLVELGLRKIGRSGLFYGDQQAAWGQIRRVQDLVTVRALVQPTEPHPLYRESPVSKPNAVPYEIDGREARHYDFDGDSFLSVEPYKGSFAVNWSTALPIATVLERMDSSLLDAVRSCLVFDPANRGHRSVEMEEALSYLRSGLATYPFVRFESEELVFVWQRPAYPSHVDEDVGAGRIGLVCHRFDAKMLGQMMRSTATPPLGECVEDLVKDVAEIANESTQGAR